MTRQEVLRRARELLTVNHIESASLEAEILLRQALNIDRSQLYTEPDARLTATQEKHFWQNIDRRLHGEPSAYITGKREFFGLEFDVDGSVLIPRPETELLVEKAIERAGKYARPTIADVGTGCGAIAVSLAVYLPHAKIFAVDNSRPALAIARKNCRKHGVIDRVTLLYGNLLDPLPEMVDIIVANLPYVRTEELSQVNTIGFEPRSALDGGADGLQNIREILPQVQENLLPGGCLMLETGIGEAKAVVHLLHGLGLPADIDVWPDLSGIDRVVTLTL